MLKGNNENPDQRKSLIQFLVLRSEVNRSCSSQGCLPGLNGGSWLPPAVHFLLFLTDIPPKVISHCIKYLTSQHISQMLFVICHFFAISWQTIVCDEENSYTSFYCVFRWHSDAIIQQILLTPTIYTHSTFETHCLVYITIYMASFTTLST